MRVAVTACLLLIAVTTLAPAARAQAQPPASPPPPQPTFRTGVGVVRVDVTVSGPKDQPVDGLTADDFEVQEDGAPQVIQSLQFVRRSGTRPEGDDTSLDIRSASHAAAEAARDDVRLLVIFVDDYHLRFGPQFDYRLKRMLRGFIEAEMRETDLFAVMAPLTPMDDLGLTRSKHDVIERIDQVQGRLGGFVPPRSALEESQMYLQGGDRMRVRAEVTLSALQSLAHHLGAMGEGRKSVLFISEGPIASSDVADMYHRLREVVTAANRSNVTIHTLDPRALGESRGTSFVNDTLSGETGGRRLAQSNDYSKGLRAVMADASAYYLIGYSPTRQVWDGKFHEIAVRVRRKGVRVLARKGYWAPTAEESRPRTPVPTAPIEISTALGRLSTRTPPKAVDWWLGFDRSEDATSATLSWEPAQPRPATSAIARLAVDVSNGGAIETHTALAAASSATGPWHVRFRVQPGPQKIRIRVEGAAGEVVDDWTEQVDVPDLTTDRPTLGTPRVYRAATPVQWRALVSSQEGVAPSAGRVLRRTDRVLVTVPVYPASPAATIHAELVNQHGKTLVALPVARGSASHMPQIELPLASLAQAEYVLRVSVEPAAGASPQVVAFAVVP
jgi:VWFA-related protein